MKKRKKLKTKRTLAQRVKITKNGVVVRKKVGLKHLKVNKTTNQKIRFRAGGKVLNKKFRKKFKNMLGKLGKSL